MFHACMGMGFQRSVSARRYDCSGSAATLPLSDIPLTNPISTPCIRAAAPGHLSPLARSPFTQPHKWRKHTHTPQQVIGIDELVAMATANYNPDVAPRLPRGQRRKATMPEESDKRRQARPKSKEHHGRAWTARQLERRRALHLHPHASCLGVDMTVRAVCSRDRWRW